MCDDCRKTSTLIQSLVRTVDRLERKIDLMAAQEHQHGVSDRITATIKLEAENKEFAYKLKITQEENQSLLTALRLLSKEQGQVSPHLLSGGQGHVYRNNSTYCELEQPDQRGVTDRGGDWSSHRKPVQNQHHTSDEQDQPAQRGGSSAKWSGKNSKGKRNPGYQARKSRRNVIPMKSTVLGDSMVKGLRNNR